MPQEMIRVGLVGVTGYTGMELARLLTGHPNMKLTAATSRTEAGKRLGDLYPFLNGLPGADVILIEPEPELIAKECDLAFLAVPHTAATEMAAALVERGLKVVDLSADFRLKSAETYEQWYKVEHKRPDLLPEAVYGLPELYASDIAKARLVANPGCYPTSIILGIGRAIGETMAVIMIAGNQPRLVNNILLGVRTLTGNIVIEMGYATGLHREALIATGVVLFVFILIINFSVALLKRRGEHE